MSTYPVQNKYGKQFFGNSRKKEVHDLRRETANCQINEILAAGHAVGFVPDTHEEAKRCGYDNCHYCLGGSKR